MNMLTYFPEHVQVVRRNKARRDRDDRAGASGVVMSGGATTRSVIFCIDRL
jgi:hypothetical protein